MAIVPAENIRLMLTSIDIPDTNTDALLVVVSEAQKLYHHTDGAGREEIARFTGRVNGELKGRVSV